MYGSEPDNTWHAKQAILEEKNKNAINDIPMKTYKNIVNHIPGLKQYSSDLGKGIALGGAATAFMAPVASAGEDMQNYSPSEIGELVYSLASQGISPQILSGIPQVADAIEAYSNEVIANSLNQQLAILAEVSNTAQKEVAKEEAASKNTTEEQRLADCLKVTEDGLKFTERYKGVYGTGSAGVNLKYDRGEGGVNITDKRECAYLIRDLLHCMESDDLQVETQIVVEAYSNKLDINPTFQRQIQQATHSKRDYELNSKNYELERLDPVEYKVEYKLSRDGNTKKYTVHLDSRGNIDWHPLGFFSNGEEIDGLVYEISAVKGS